MALVTDGWKGSITFGGKDDSTQTVNLDFTATAYADVVTDCALVITAYSGVSGGVIKGYNIREEFIEDNYTRPSNEDSEGGEHAYVTVGIEGNPFKKATIGIPFPLIGLFLATAGVNRNVIDPTDTAIGILANKYSASGQLYISDGEVAEGVLNGQRD